MTRLQNNQLNNQSLTVHRFYSLHIIGANNKYPNKIIYLIPHWNNKVICFSCTNAVDIKCLWAAGANVNHTFFYLSVVKIIEIIFSVLYLHMCVSLCVHVQSRRDFYLVWIGRNICPILCAHTKQKVVVGFFFQVWDKLGSTLVSLEIKLKEKRKFISCRLFMKRRVLSFKSNYIAVFHWHRIAASHLIWETKIPAAITTSTYSIPYFVLCNSLTADF